LSVLRVPHFIGVRSCVSHRIAKQDSLANAKVNARQHCVNEMPITDYILEYNNFSLGDEDSDNIASERYENQHPRRPLSCLTPHISRTPANICITLISLKVRSPDYISAADSMGLSAFKFLWWAQTCEITRNSQRIRPYSSSRSSKVIDLGVNRKSICDFLLVINNNFGRIWYRFRDIDA